MKMTYTEKAKFNRNIITSSRPLRKFGRNLFFSLALPIIFGLIAVILSSIAHETLFVKPGDSASTLKNIMLFVKSVTLTIVAALALNSNLNSGRMDFSLGATGILAALLASEILGGDISTINNIVAFLLLTILIGMILGFINSLVFIFLKLPPIVMSLGMCLVFEGIAKIIVGGNNSKKLIDSEITGNFFIEPVVIIPILAIVVIFMSLAFCYSQYGYNKNALVYDQKISVDTGIKEVRNCIACFIIAGGLIGLYQVIDTCSLSNVSVKVDLGSSSTVFKNFLPIFIGGILAKYSNQIIGLLLAVISTTLLSTGMDAANMIGFSADVQSLITGFSVFAVLVYMVDKQRFVDWVKKVKYVITQKRLGRDTSEEEAI